MFKLRLGETANETGPASPAHVYGRQAFMLWRVIP